MALMTHPKETEGVYENNLPRVAGLEVQIRKAKRYEIEWLARVKVEVRKKNKGYVFFEKEKEKDTRTNLVRS